MQNKLALKIVQFLPLLGILLIFVVQNYHAYQSLQANDDLARKQIENLKADMLEDNIPSDVRGHISNGSGKCNFSNSSFGKFINYDADIFSSEYFVDGLFVLYNAK